MEGLFVCYIDPDGAIARFKRNDCSISPVEVIWRSGVRTQRTADILELLHAQRNTSSTIFCSQYYDSGWYDQLGGDDSSLAEAILDRIKHDAYKINIVPTNPANYRSIREVYGLDKSLSE